MHGEREVLALDLLERHARWPSRRSARGRCRRSRRRSGVTIHEVSRASVSPRQAFGLVIGVMQMSLTMSPPGDGFDWCRGSSASRRPSPSTLSAMTMPKIIRPGIERHPGRLREIALGRVEHAAPRRRRRLLAQPQERQARLGDDGRGDREARLDEAAAAACWAGCGARRCARASSPSARAASTYSSVLIASTVPRARRRKVGRAAMPIAIMALVRLGPEEGGQRDGHDEERDGEHGVGDAHDEPVHPAARRSPRGARAGC